MHGSPPPASKSVEPQVPWSCSIYRPGGGQMDLASSFHGPRSRPFVGWCLAAQHVSCDTERPGLSAKPPSHPLPRKLPGIKGRDQRSPRTSKTSCRSSQRTSVRRSLPTFWAAPAAARVLDVERLKSMMGREETRRGSNETTPLGNKMEREGIGWSTVKY